MTRVITLLTALFSSLIVNGLAPCKALATSPYSFPARVTLTLCPEYRLRSGQGIVVEIRYASDSNPAPQNAIITAQGEYNEAANSRTYDIELPDFYGTQQFQVSAYCRNAAGYSAASNVARISNCDRLALYDDDADGFPNSSEDTNCDNFFSPGDFSNPHNVDTDGDGVRDLVEFYSGSDPTNPGSSPRPYIFASAPFDPDGDIPSGGNANPVVWRPSNGTWYIRDFLAPNRNIAVQFGLSGDTPFSYIPKTAGGALLSDIGVVRRDATELRWFFNGAGLAASNGTRRNIVSFGLFGDNLIPGPWEEAPYTNPAVARLFDNHWTFFIYKRDGTVRMEHWGGNGDIPKVQDYDGDGLFDIAVFRPSEQKSYIVNSSGGIAIINFGTGTADHTVRGDYTNDGIDDISFWEPLTGFFTTMRSDNGFDDNLAAAKDSAYYEELQLGLYQVHLPLSWNIRNGRFVYTVVDHASGRRFWRPDNSPASAPVFIQWGLPGDAQG